MKARYLLLTATMLASLAYVAPAGADTVTTSLPVVTLPTPSALTTLPLTTISLPTPSIPSLPSATTLTIPSASSSSASYTSLAAAMVNYYAKGSGQSLSAWTKTNGATMNSLLGGSATASTLSQLTKELTKNGTSLNLTGVTSMQGLLNSVTSAQGTVDGQATLKGMSLAQQLGSLYSSTAKTASSDSALFGLFYNQSLTKALTTSPSIFATVGTSLTSPSATAAWNNAMASAAASTGQSLSSLPDPCLVGMLSAMATGSTSGSATSPSCAPCDVAGSFLNSTMTKVLNPSTNNLITGSGGVSASAWSQLQGWLQKGTLAQNPSLAATVNPSAATTSSLTSCSASSSATQGALKKTLPGVFSKLGTP